MINFRLHVCKYSFPASIAGAPPLIASVDTYVIIGIIQWRQITRMVYEGCVFFDHWSSVTELMDVINAHFDGCSLVIDEMAVASSIYEAAKRNRLGT